MSNRIAGTLGGIDLPVFTIPFLDKPLENAVDVVTLDGSIYTDFTSLRTEYELNFAAMDEDVYNDIMDVYLSQFSTLVYPTFTCPYYEINTPVRMYINEKDPRMDGRIIRDVQIRLVRQSGIS